MTEQQPAAPVLTSYCAHCQAQTPHWRGLVSGRQRYVCKMCWHMAGEGTMQPRTWQSDLREDR